MRASSRRLLYFERAGFTLMEIAICLAIVGIALVAIIGVLPIGMNVQQTNREETIIGQDSTVFMEAIRNGTLGMDDLTNYVYAITNFWGQYNAAGAETAQGAIGYTWDQAVPSGNTYPYKNISLQPITNGANVVGLLSTPEFVGPSSVGDAPGQPIPSLLFGGISNHIVAYVYSISGPAVQKPPQDNSIVRQDSFGYRIYCVNTPVPMDTNLFFGSGIPAGNTPAYTPTVIWNPSFPYKEGVPPLAVFWDWMYWSCPWGAPRGVAPGTTNLWQILPNYSLERALNMHELRLTFLWPQLANGNLGPNRHTFRTVVAGQLMNQPPYTANDAFNSSKPVYNTNLYMYLPQSFTNTP